MKPGEYFQKMMAGDFVNSRIFFDSPKGKSVFAYGAWYALKRLQDDFSEDELNAIIEEFQEFADGYMGRNKGETTR